MDKESSARHAMLAPGAPVGVSAYHLPAASPARSAPMPAVDERLVEPETRQEMFRGRKLYASPAEAPHGDRHCELDYVVRAHVRDGYVASADLLTRADRDSDFATDTSIRKAGSDPETGGRFLEEVSFEVVNEQSLKRVTERAEMLINRGVRRMFAILVKKGEVREWLPARKQWRVLDPDGVIRDRTLERPLQVKALLEGAAADRAVGEALWARREPFLVDLHQEGREEGREEGRKEALAEAILRALTRRGLEPSAELREQILGCRDLTLLQQWFDRALVAECPDEVVAG